MMLINPYRFGGVALLLDTYPGAAAAYSLRKLRTAYTGYCIEVRRSSDDTTQDIGFVNGVLDESTLTTFCGAGNGFVHTWYDQSENGKDATHTTTAEQYKIVNSGAVIKKNNKPVMIRANTYSVLLTSLSINSGTNCWIFSSFNLPASGSRSVLLLCDINYSYLCMVYTDPSYATTGGVSSKYYYLNGVLVDPTPTTRTEMLNTLVLDTQRLFTSNITLSTNWDNIKLGNNGSYSIGGADMQEIIIYPTDKSANRSEIEANINSFYSIY